MNNFPSIELVSRTGLQFFDLDHRSIQERRDLFVRPVASGDATDDFRRGLGVIHSAMADAAREMGFKIAEGDSGQLFRDLGRSVASHDKMRAAAARAELAHPGTQADAALQDASTLADSYGKIMRDTRRKVVAPCAQALAGHMISQYGKQAAADMVSKACNAGGTKVKTRGALADAATMADADLNQAGGLVENLTSYLFMSFVEPIAPQHYRDVFRIQGGINIGLQFLQVLFYTIRGEAKVWDGTDGDYGISGPGVGQLKLPVMNFRSSDTLDIITAARELLVFGAANLRIQQLKRAHDFMHNRLAFGLQVPAPGDVQGSSLKNWPGLTVKNDGATYNSTSLTIYQEMVKAIMEPMTISNQAFEPDTLVFPVGFSQLIKQPMVIGGVAVADSIESYFRKNFPGVDLKVAWEMSNLFASGTDALLAFPKSGDAAPVYIMNEPIMLPQFTYGYGVRADMYSTSAGLVWGAPVGAEVRLVTQA